MKSLKTPLLGLLLLLAILGCQKDLQQNQLPPENGQPKVSAVSKNANVTESEWKANLNWSSVELPSHSVFYTNVKTDISAETADQGLVRIFKSSGSNAQSLPFEENVNGRKYYWYYQVTEGNVLISVDVYGSKENPGGIFKSVVLNKEAVSGFEAKGYSKTELMKMPLETLTTK